MAYTPVPSEVDDAAFSVGSDRVSPSGLLFDDASTDSVDEGDVGIPRMSADRVAYARDPDLTASTTFTAAGQTLELDLYGRGSIAIQTTGVFTGSVNFEVSVDGTNWLGAQGINTLLSTRNSAVTTPTIMMVGTSGYSKFRARCATLTAGTIGVFLRATSGSYPVTNVSEQALSAVAGSAFDGRTNAPPVLVTAANQTILGMEYGHLFNETTWDRERGTVERTLLASAARTATTNSADQINYNGSALIVSLNITVVPGVDTVQLIVQGRDPVSGVYYDLVADAATAAAGMRCVAVGLGAGAAAAGINAVGPFPLPRTWRARIVHSAGTSFTYSVGCSIV